jgi:hypothetical protein
MIQTGFHFPGLKVLVASSHPLDLNDRERSTTRNTSIGSEDKTLSTTVKEGYIAKVKDVSGSSGERSSTSGAREAKPRGDGMVSRSPFV